MDGKVLRILGTRGIPAAHGGFETFAEHLALYLARRGWQITVYCQQDGVGAVYEDSWQGVRRVHIPIPMTLPGALRTIIFDWKSTLHAAREPGLVLTLGYNTAVFCLVYRLKGITNLINMDGIEWRRGKWNRLERAWLYLNERAGCWLGNHLIADHPEIKAHLATRVAVSKITMIPYGSDRIDHSNSEMLAQYQLQSGGYAIVIARPEPENSVREIVAAFSRKHRGIKLVVLGKYCPGQTPYHRQVLEAAGEEVKFLGAIYDKNVVRALRFHAVFYAHGHQVGGTNPSLVEAMGAGSAVLAHGNHFNRWVAGPAARYFEDEQQCADQLDAILSDATVIERMRESSRKRHAAVFTWESVHEEYEGLLEKWLSRAGLGISDPTG